MNRLVLLPSFLLTLGTLVMATVGSSKIKASHMDNFKAIWQIAEALHRRAALDDGEQAATSQERARDEVAADLLAERIGLLEAAVRFRNLNRRMTGGGRYALNEFRGQSEGEQLCRQVIARIGVYESDSESLAFRRRLEGELEELLQREGAVRLPEESVSPQGANAAVWPLRELKAARCP